MKIYCLLLFSLVISLNSLAQNKPQKGYQLQSTSNAVQYKNYYLLTLFQKDPAVKKLLQNDAELSNFLKNKRAKITAAITNCTNDIGCFTNVIKFSDDEIDLVGKHLADLYKQQNELGLLVKNHLIASGCYALYENLASKEILQKAWVQDAKAINYAINVYVEGQKPNYPKIDSIGFNVKDKSYAELVNTNALLSLDAKNTLFFEPALQFALVALEINERNDAADYEPMISTVNKAALLAIRKTNFSAYKYSLILVPGEGPEEEATALSAGGMLRCRLAAEQFRKGLAPFIMVSGGRVHPFKTKYSEAFEMKVFLMKNLQIPESAIIMEPHARHTTTNLRNAARLIFRYNMPVEKPGLIITVKSQSTYISDVMLQRCTKELGYEPYRNGKRLSDTALEFYPDAMSLQIDFDEPLDP
ncbi:YdcF family protein [Pedobacter punctiformis]|uniref:YdcF family protein n=1 Tax=Pedobacter punctiformis TaxID=3004097 RepID=A0ABT4L5D0_9SPHI|nr:YdcF family protein [Pedobacter sp. HCMS5-2]MCZ4243129.1 YdcF family protein [Pedobacter sp. HCMS5-2]